MQDSRQSSNSSSCTVENAPQVQLLDDRSHIPFLAFLSSPSIDPPDKREGSAHEEWVSLRRQLAFARLAGVSGIAVSLSLHSPWGDAISLCESFSSEASDLPFCLSITDFATLPDADADRAISLSSGISSLVSSANYMRLDGAPLIVLRGISSISAARTFSQALRGAAAASDGPPLHIAAEWAGSCAEADDEAFDSFLTPSVLKDLLSDHHQPASVGKDGTASPVVSLYQGSSAEALGAHLRYLRSYADATAPVGKTCPIWLDDWQALTSANCLEALRAVEQVGRSWWVRQLNGRETAAEALVTLRSEVSPCRTTVKMDCGPVGQYTGRTPIVHSIAVSLRRIPLVSCFLRWSASSLHATSGFLRKNVSTGPSSSPLAAPTVARLTRMPPQKTAVLVHAFYLDLLPELRDIASRFIDPFDLLITTPHHEHVPLIEKALAGVSTNLSVAVCENRGRDIAPFLGLLKTGHLDGYSEVLKLHLKGSFYSKQGELWRRSLVRCLCGDGEIIRHSIELLRAGSVGIVGPHPFFLSQGRFWGRNKRAVAALLRNAGALAHDREPNLGFFAGSMFWFKPMALRTLRLLPDELLPFPEERGQQDGTTAHAIERCIPALVRQAGFNVSSLELQGCDIFSTDTSANEVPVM